MDSTGYGLLYSALALPASLALSRGSPSWYRLFDAAFMGLPAVSAFTRPPRTPFNKTTRQRNAWGMATIPPVALGLGASLALEEGFPIAKYLPKSKPAALLTGILAGLPLSYLAYKGSI